MVEREVFCLGKQTHSGATWAEWRDGDGLGWIATEGGLPYSVAIFD
jgi:hypothetical protein